MKTPEPDHEKMNHFAHIAGHVFGFAYIVVTLLFGPVKSLATWLAQQSFIQRYKVFVANLPPAVGFALSLFSLGLLELSKIAVLMAYHKGGLLLALCTTLCAKISFGYLAHTTWHAARPRVIEAYPRVRSLDAWVGRQLDMIKGFRDRIVLKCRNAAWYPALAGFVVLVGRQALGVKNWLKQVFINRAGKNPKA